MTATTRALVECARDGDARGARRRRVRAGLRVDAGILLALVMAVALVAGVLMRPWYLQHDPIDADQALVGIFARRILAGHTIGFLLGQRYGGVEPYLVAGAFALGGSSALVLELPVVPLEVIGCGLVWRVACRLVHRPALAVVAAAVKWVAPQSVVWSSTMEYGFRGVPLAQGHLLRRARRAEREGSRSEVGFASSPPISTSEGTCPSGMGPVGTSCHLRRGDLPGKRLPMGSVADAPLLRAAGMSALWTSVWPGGAGAAVLVGHDVTWFHDLGHLRPGQRIEYISGCRSFTYAVQSMQVVTRGAPVANTPGSLALVTCWPLDALWFTGQRLLVLAHAVGGSVAARAVSVASTPPVPTLAVSPALAGVDSLAANPTPLGTLTVIGKPATRFDESPGPLADAAAAQDLYFAAVRAAETGDIAEWSVIAPSVPISAASPFNAASITGFLGSLTTELDVDGNEITGAVLGVELTLSGQDPGTYKLSVTEAVVDGRLGVIGWPMASA